MFGHGSSQNVLNFLDKRQEGKIALPAFSMISAESSAGFLHPH
ncbi:hypothetical protein CEV33_4246 [Brucella grignonensis]|uniref:Uncharacterized protein n=1 Tax=Brucella grignonensis TaxID=94627 RepID=A0A256FQU4_9HYPH|nr:hypothetical protein CEV33_4246 [Brucella grignonensis]